MWIFTSDAFVSVVEHRESPDVLVVRARKRVDLARFLPAHRHNIVEIPGDYPFRLFVARHEVAEAAFRAVQDIAYPNFKASVHEGDRHDFYLAVWSQGCRFERGEFERDLDEYRGDCDHRQGSLFRDHWPPPKRKRKRRKATRRPRTDPAFEDDDLPF